MQENYQTTSIYMTLYVSRMRENYCQLPRVLFSQLLGSDTENQWKKANKSVNVPHTLVSSRCNNANLPTFNQLSLL